jgi:hypothetical protein
VSDYEIELHGNCQEIVDDLRASLHASQEQVKVLEHHLQVLTEYLRRWGMQSVPTGEARHLKDAERALTPPTKEGET